MGIRRPLETFIYRSKQIYHLVSGSNDADWLTDHSVSFSRPTAVDYQMEAPQFGCIHSSRPPKRRQTFRTGMDEVIHSVLQYTDPFPGVAQLLQEFNVDLFLHGGLELCHIDIKLSRLPVEDCNILNTFFLLASAGVGKDDSSKFIYFTRRKPCVTI